MLHGRGLAGATLGPDGKIYVMGGLHGLGQGVPMAEVESYDPRTNRWENHESLPQARCCLASAVADGKLLAIGGWMGESTTSEVDVLDPASGSDSTWQHGPQLEGGGRTDHGAASCNGRTWVVGGQTTTTGDVLAEEAAVLVDGKWTAQAGPKKPRFFPGVVAGPDGRIFVVGGAGGTLAKPEVIREVAILDCEGETWTEGSPMSVGRYKGAAAVTPDGRILYAGGTDENGAKSAVVEAYDPVRDEWKTLKELPLPMTDSVAVAAPDGRVFLFGGAPLGSGALDFTLVYDSQRHVWYE